MPMYVHVLLGLGIGILVGVLFGAYPAMQIANIDLGQALRTNAGEWFDD